LGGLRSAAQIVSYELSLNSSILSVIVVVSGMGLTEVIEYQDIAYLSLPLLPVLFLFFIFSLAEINRAPFDLPEAEAELVAGYNIDYSSINFAFFFLAEYAHIVLASFIISFIFFGGLLLILLPSFCLFLIIQVRASLPRYRYDQLMKLG
jgi:NADH-quinone oxidoreductase subunit H